MISCLREFLSFALSRNAEKKPKRFSEQNICEQFKSRQRTDQAISLVHDTRQVAAQLSSQISQNGSEGQRALIDMVTANLLDALVQSDEDLNNSSLEDKIRILRRIASSVADLARASRTDMATTAEQIALAEKRENERLKKKTALTMKRAGISAQLRQQIIDSL